MAYIYTLTNLKNNKKFVGKTKMEIPLLRRVLFDSLNHNRHYNDFLQFDWLKYPFKFEYFECDKCLKKHEQMVEENELRNPLYGYNVLNDLPARRGRFPKTEEYYNEDLCLWYTFYPNIQLSSYNFLKERNTISNRLSKNQLFEDSTYRFSITDWHDYCFRAVRMLYIEETCMTTNQMVDRISKRYHVGSQVRVTPRRMSKFLAGQHIKRHSKRIYGTVIYCPEGIEKTLMEIPEIQERKKKDEQ